jgi:peptide/nickel transport system substrate-binding protein
MTRRYRWLVVTSVLLVVSVLVFSSCSPMAVPTQAPSAAVTEVAEATEAPAASTEAPVAGPRRGGTLVIALQGSPATMDPQGGTGIPMYMIYQTFELLMDRDENWDYMPLLATSWEWDDASHLRVKLRQGVTFHSGDPFNAEAVQKSVERFQEPGAPGRAYALLQPLKKVDVVNDYEIVIETDGPFTPLNTHLAHVAASIIDAPQAARLGTEYGSDPSGTGPFRFVSWERDNQIVQERNPDYWDEGLPYLDKVIWRIMPDANTRVLALEAGEVDMALMIPPHEVERLRNDPNIKVIETPITRSVYMMVSYKKKPFDELKIRQALNYAVDRATIVDVIQEGTVDLATIPYPKNVPGSAEGMVKVYEYDPAKAQQLLDEAGWTVGSDGIREKDGEKLTLRLAYPEGIVPNGKETVEVIQQNLHDVGIDVTIDVETWPAFWSALQGREHEASVVGIAAVNGDPHYIFTNQWTCDGLWNDSAYCNSEVDQLVADAQRVVDEEERLAKYVEAQQILAEEAAAVPLFHMKWYTGLRNYVQDVMIAPSEHILLRKAWLTEDAPER